MTVTRTRPEVSPPITLQELALLFLWMGIIGFGGGMAVVSMLQRELVDRRRVMLPDEFLHGVALGQILGPAAVNTAIFVGSRSYGPLGGLLCATAFVTPSVVLVTILSWLYFTYHALPALQAVLIGLGPVVIALITSAAWSMGRVAVRTPLAAMTLVAAIACALLNVNSIAILGFGALLGLIGGEARFRRHPDNTPPARVAVALPPFTFVAALSAGATGPGLVTLATTFLKSGLVFVGGGFVLIPILHDEIVTRLGWLTPREFLDGVAISNITPGPIAVLATFTGYKVHGVSGALIATIALFLPAVVLMSVLSHYYTRLKNEARIKDALSGLAVVVVGLVMSAALRLAPAALHSASAIAVCAVSLFLIIRAGAHPALVLALGAAAGIVGIVR